MNRMTIAPENGLAPSPYGPVPERELIDALAAAPRRIPPDVRGEIASILVTEIIGGVTYPLRDSGKFMRRYGLFYPVYIHLRHSEEWQALRRLAATSPETAVPVTRLLVMKIFDLLEDINKDNRDLDGELIDLLSWFGRSPARSGDPSGEPQVPGDDEVFRLLAALLHLLSQLLQEQARNFPWEKLPDDIMDAVQMFEKMRSDPQKAGFDFDPEEMDELIDTLKKAVDACRTARADGVGGPLPAPDRCPYPGEPAGTVPDPLTGTAGGGNSTIPGTASGQGRGAAPGTGAESLAGLIGAVARLLREIKRRAAGRLPAGMPEAMNIPETRRSGPVPLSAVQKAVLEPVAVMLRSLAPRQNTLGLLAQIHPGKNWSMEIASLREDRIPDLEHYVALVDKNSGLKEILKEIGRTAHDYGTRRQSISPMGRSEMYSVMRSREIARLLPAETVKIHHSLYRKKFYADFTEGKLLTYSLQGRNWSSGRPKKKKGPVVALVDISGSMSGIPEILAKAIVFALTRAMLRQDRDVRVILFSGPGNTREIELTSKRKMASEFLRFLNTSFCGGTDFNTALKSGLRSLQQPAFRGADLLFITDGVSDISNPRCLHRWKEVKKEQRARIFSCIIGGNDAGGLAPVSDYVYFVRSGPSPVPAHGDAAGIRFIPSPHNPDRVTVSRDSKTGYPRF